MRELYVVICVVLIVVLIYYAWRSEGMAATPMVHNQHEYVSGPFPSSLLQTLPYLNDDHKYFIGYGSNGKAKFAQCAYCPSIYECPLCPNMQTL